MPIKYKATDANATTAAGPLLVIWSNARLALEFSSGHYVR